MANWFIEQWFTTLKAAEKFTSRNQDSKNILSGFLGVSTAIWRACKQSNFEGEWLNKTVWEWPRWNWIGVMAKRFAPDNICWFNLAFIPSMSSITTGWIKKTSQSQQHQKPPQQTIPTNLLHCLTHDIKWLCDGKCSLSAPWRSHWLSVNPHQPFTGGAILTCVLSRLISEQS